MEKVYEGVLRLPLSEEHTFLLKSGVFLALAGAMLYLLLVTPYPAIHDAVHEFRHALAIVPCH